MGADRPAPTSTDVLAQIRDELVGLRQDLAGARGGAVDPFKGDGRVELREPATAPRSISGVTPEPDCQS